MNKPVAWKTPIDCASQKSHPKSRFGLTIGAKALFCAGASTAATPTRSIVS